MRETASPPQTFNDALYTLFEVERAYVNTRYLGFRGQSVDHINRKFDSIVFDLLVIVLKIVWLVSHVLGGNHTTYSYLHKV